MAKKKKNGNKATPVEIVVLITAILNLVRTLIDLIISRWDKKERRLPIP